MLNARWLLGLTLMVSSALPACTSRTSLGRDDEDAGRERRDVGPGMGDTGQVTPPANPCAYGTTQLDVSCNEDSTLSLSAGHCGPDGTCSCQSGFVLNPTSNRCRLAVDAEVVMCIVGDDRTCDDQKSATGSGTCLGKGCACNSGFVLNPATGRCRAGEKSDAATPAPDAWVGKDSGGVVVDAPVGNDMGKDSAGVCTFGMNQTCNDNSIYSWVAGTCQSNGTCVCASGFVLNASGLCAPAPRDAGPDLPPDSKTVCTPGMAASCNDDPIIAAVLGVCQPNGTCTCGSGYEKNPSTGRCRRPEVTSCSGSFTACGCACCLGRVYEPVCYYPSAGDSLSAIRAADDATSKSPTCETAGCSVGLNYQCCVEAAAEPAGSAQYKAAYRIGGIDRITLDKTGNDGNCVSLILAYANSGSDLRPLRLTTPTNWSLDGSISAGACGATLREQSMGAQGTVTFTSSGTSCALDAHLTAFFYSASTGTIGTMRIDADNVPITGGGPMGYCK